jgi:tetratricopeptide (TPR) repeat protein
VDPTTGRCLYCASPAEEAQAQTAETPVWRLDKPGGQADARDHELGLLLFEAEEALARGAPEKAAVLASKAVKDRPESLTARALHERARRELLRGRRRERLESRVREAEGLVANGDAQGAERIVTSALKLIPSHPLALALFARLKERRQQASTAEAWAEQELERLTRARARRSLEAAQAEMAAGRERAAMMALRRGLRHAPDDPELLGMLRDVEKSMEREKAGQHAVQAQVRAGLDLMAQGQMEESLRVLRAVLRVDPDNQRAQVAIQQVRKAWLRRQAVAAAAPPSASPPAPAPVVPGTAATPIARPTGPPAAAPAPPVARARPPKAAVQSPAAAASPVSWQHLLTTPASFARAGSMRVALVVGGAVALLVVGAIALRATRQPRAPAGARGTIPTGTPPPAATAPAPPTSLAPGPLEAADPALRRGVETVLASYARALETADAGLLAQARPDLAPDARARLLAPFAGAINAATDLRVLDIQTRGDLAVVTLLRTEIIVGGRTSPRDPTEETLRFRRRGGQWLLVR